MNTKKTISVTGTGSLLLINLTLFAILNLVPNTNEFLLINPSIEILIQKPWTLITVFFSHEIWFHLISNMVLLIYFGIHLERLVGGKTVIYIYLVTGLLGSLTIPFLAPVIQWEGLVAGASGACFGIVGAFAAIRPNHRFIKKGSKWLNVLFGGNAKYLAILLFVFNLLNYIIDPSIGIGAGAHGVGILVGALCGWYCKKNISMRQNKN